VADGDVAALVREFELTKGAARRRIREAGGNTELAMLRLMGVAEDDKGAAVLARFEERIALLQTFMDDAAALAEAKKKLAERDAEASA